MTVSTQSPWALRLERGIALIRRNLLHAALEALAPDAIAQWPEDLRPEACHQIGRVLLALGRYQESVRWFSRAADAARSPGCSVRYRINLAVAYRYIHPDRSHRLITEILFHDRPHLSPLLRGVLYNNLSDVQWINGFYSEGYESALRSLEAFTEAGQEDGYDELYLNLGVFCLELGHYDEAKWYLMRAVAGESEVPLHAHTELSRLYFLQGDVASGLRWASAALPHVWSSVMHNARREISRFCRLLALLAERAGERDLAVRLMEKAQLMFGRLDMWREWTQAQSELDRLLQAPSQAAGSGPILPGVRAEDVAKFLTWLEVMNAQEVLHPDFSHLIDTRVHYAQEIADALELPARDRHTLTYACRFADYGLTAMEPDVLANPKRSPEAWRDYQQHPVLGIRMLEPLGIPPAVLTVIEQHHEHVDGTGYPHGRRLQALHPLARVLAVADHYATGVTVRGLPHSRVMAELWERAGTWFDASVVAALASRFED
ncbi:HD domain-containing phosphohydrolase [Alicyclobacillus sp.]|uniref:HD domain-containing phosphohydrolase n=1 Tax=Alicyclobacillus sp. TaxID=61169 RepID=UPI0025C50E3D|nr:HD domain-containing phosphohydrolase [Alicyclobacillus sp.]MCL6517970.1 HD domain-containing protein [Alicyclobacillus sp.]